MKARNLLIAVFCLLAVSILSSCEPSAVRQGRDLYKAYFNKMLKDPSSFVVYDEKYEVSETNKYTVEWKLDYGAKNGWGAMDRETVEFTTVGDNLISFKYGKIYNKEDLK